MSYTTCTELDSLYFEYVYVCVCGGAGALVFCEAPNFHPLNRTFQAREILTLKF